jgi:hypothetical protein
MNQSTITNHQEYVASMVATAFNDQEQLYKYRIYCKKYPLAIIHRAYAEAKSVSDTQVRKSRAALFFYLAKLYAKQRTTTPHSP